MIATVVNITVPKAMVDAILIAQEEGKITLVKVDEEAQLAQDGAPQATAAPTTVTDTVATPAPTDAVVVQ